jgi:uncharacterized membrane protein
MIIDLALFILTMLVVLSPLLLIWRWRRAARSHREDQEYLADLQDRVQSSGVGWRMSRRALANSRRGRR